MPHQFRFTENALKASRPHYRFRSVFPVHTKMLETLQQSSASATNRLDQSSRDVNGVSVFESLRFRCPPDNTIGLRFFNLFTLDSAFSNVCVFDGNDQCFRSFQCRRQPGENASKSMCFQTKAHQCGISKGPQFEVTGLTLIRIHVRYFANKTNIFW